MNTFGQRIKRARGSLSQDAFSNLIQISKGSLGFYERDENLPKIDVVLKICSETGVSIEWLMTGEGPMRPDDAVPEQNQTATLRKKKEEDSQQCVELKAELEEERRERRELAIENRQLHRDKAELLRVNGELREKIARLEERKRRHDLTHGFSEEGSNVA